MLTIVHHNRGRSAGGEIYSFCDDTNVPQFLAKVFLSIVNFSNIDNIDEDAVYRYLSTTISRKGSNLQPLQSLYSALRELIDSHFFSAKV